MPAANTNQPKSKRTVQTRRSFLHRTVKTILGVGVAGLVYGGIEASWVQVERLKISIPRLPVAWHGATVALLTDIHHGPFTSVNYIQRVVEMTNSLQPDITCITGDFVHRSKKYFQPCIQALAGLTAKYGVFAVPGNHDYYEGIQLWHQAISETKIQELTNKGVWLERENAGLRIAGVDDLWQGSINLQKALGDTSSQDACLLLNHNPDFIEALRDLRVSLALSGHTHGGQCVVPGIGAPVTPSQFGQKYLHGLVQGPVAQVYVSRGLGTITPPIRFYAPPELTLIELQSPAKANV